MKRRIAALLAFLICLSVPVNAAEMQGQALSRYAAYYTVTYEAGEAGTLIGKATERVRRNATPQEVPEIEPKEGWTFLGWSRDGERLEPVTEVVIQEDTTFTALYQESYVEKNTYIKGDKDGIFQPDNPATRGELAAMLARLTAEFDPEIRYVGPAPDVPEERWYSNYVRFCVEKGYMGGYGDGTFRPENNITRGEFATMLARYLQLEERAVGGFTDISDHWAAGYINALQKAGVVNGYGDGTFRPSWLLTRAEAVSMINRAVGLIYDHSARYWVSFADVPQQHWAYQAIMAAANTDISVILK